MGPPRRCEVQHFGVGEHALGLGGRPRREGQVHVTCCSVYRIRNKPSMTARIAAMPMSQYSVPRVFVFGVP